MRFAVAILITTGAIAGYHWLVYRSEKELMSVGLVGPGLVILVGPKDIELSRSISKMTGGRVQFWARKDDNLGTWVQDDVMQALKASGDDGVMLIADSAGMQVIPIERG